jgi:hypothetical protein
MAITVLFASGPRWLNAEYTLLQLTVLFSHISKEVEFTASQTDIEPHCRELFTNAVAGDYGPIADYIFPTPHAIASNENPSLRRHHLVKAKDMVQHYSILGDTKQADAWRDYYRALYALAERETWPLVDEWPIEPVVTNR